MNLNIKTIALGLSSAATIFAVAGCGSGSGNSTPLAHIRVFDAATSSNSVTFGVNGTSDFPLLTTTSGPSSFLFINAGVPSAFTYQLVKPNSTTSVIPAGVNPIVTTYTLNANTNYTAYAMGTPDLLTPDPQTSNPNALQVRVFPDLGRSGSSANVNLQVLNSAYDAGPIDVTVNGVSAAVALPFGAMSGATTPSAGTVTVTVNKASTSTPVLPAQTVTLSGGSSETLVIHETASSPATYTLRQIEN